MTGPLCYGELRDIEGLGDVEVVDLIMHDNFTSDDDWPA